MAFENVQPGGGLEVEHDDRSFGRSYRETLGVHVEVDGWEAVKQGFRQFREQRIITQETDVWTTCTRISVAASIVASRLLEEFGSRDLTTASIKRGRFG